MAEKAIVDMNEKILDECIIKNINEMNMIKMIKISINVSTLEMTNIVGMIILLILSIVLILFSFNQQIINFLIKRNQKKYFKKYTKEEQTNWELIFYKNKKCYTYNVYKKELKSHLDKQENIQKRINMLKDAKSELNTSVYLYNKYSTYISIPSFLISLFSFVASFNLIKIENLNTSDMACFILVCVIINMICIFAGNIPQKDMRLEVINDLIQEYEEQRKKGIESKDLSNLIKILETTKQNNNDDIQKIIDFLKK